MPEQEFFPLLGFADFVMLHGLSHAAGGKTLQTGTTIFMPVSKKQPVAFPFSLAAGVRHSGGVTAAAMVRHNSGMLAPLFQGV